MVFEKLPGSGSDAEYDEIYMINHNLNEPSSFKIVYQHG